MSQDSLGLSGLLSCSSQGLDFYDNVRHLVDFVDGTSEHFMPSSENENDALLEGIDDSFENTIPKEEPRSQLEEAPLLPGPAAIPRVLSDEEYPGPYNFEVQLDPCGGKNPWVYSPVLRKIFIGINTVFPVDFKWTKVDKKLFIRATATYSLSQHNQDLVLRCMPHAQPTDASNLDTPSHVWDHVIRCNNMQAVYVGDKSRGVHLSVVVPLSEPQSGCETVREMFKFMCKNSCPSGMNRRPIQVLFTIENEKYEILGRRVLQVRICSCPKRDKDKAEREYQKEGNRNLHLNGKKRKADKQSTADLQEYRLSCKVIGKNNYIKALEYVADLMKSEAYSQGATAEPAFKRVLTEIHNQLKATEN